MQCCFGCFVWEELAERGQNTESTNLLPLVMAFDTLRTKNFKVQGTTSSCGPLPRFLLFRELQSYTILHDAAVFAPASQVFQEICTAMRDRRPDFVARYMYGGERRKGKQKKVQGSVEHIAVQ